MSQNKQCPRCRMFTLIKNSANNSLLCSTCKYLTKGIRVEVEDSMQYGGKHKYWLKIKEKKDEEDIHIKPNNNILTIQQAKKKAIQYCLKQYQKLLRAVLQKLFIPQDPQLLKKKVPIMQSARKIWLAYLTAIAKKNVNFYGIFNKTINRWQEKVISKANNKKKQQSQDDEEKDSRRESQQKEQQLQIEQQQLQKQKSKKHKSPKKKQPKINQNSRRVGNIQNQQPPQHLLRKRTHSTKYPEQQQFTQQGFQHFILLLQKKYNYLYQSTKNTNNPHQETKNDQSNISKEKQAKTRNKTNKNHSELHQTNRQVKSLSLNQIIKIKESNIEKIFQWALDNYKEGYEKQKILLIKIAEKYAEQLHQLFELKITKQQEKFLLNSFRYKTSYFSIKTINKLLIIKGIFNLNNNCITEQLTFSSQYENFSSFGRENSHSNSSHKQFKLLLLLLEGLLKRVFQRQNQHQYNFQELIGMYHLTKKQLKEGKIIQALLGTLYQQISSFQQKGKESNLSIPKISYTLIYSIIFLALLQQQIPLTLHKIISRIGYLSLPKQPSQETFLDEKLQFVHVENKQTITTEKIRKSAIRLFNYLYYNELNTNISIPKYNIDNWIQMFCKQKNIPELVGCSQNLARIMSRHEQIYQQYNKKFAVKSKNQKKTYLDQRHLFFQQDIHAMTIIFIVLKMYYGFGQDVQLIGMDYHLLDSMYKIQSTPEYESRLSSLQYLEKHPEIMSSYMQTPLKLTDIMTRIYTANRLQTASTSYSSLRTYRDIKELNCKDFQSAFPIPQKKIQLLKFPNFRKKTKITDYITLTLLDNKENAIFSTNIQQQIDVITQQCIQKQQKNIPNYLLEHPAENYEVYYDYKSMSACINRNNMQYLLEELVGKNFQVEKLFEVLEWYERILILYERK